MTLWENFKSLIKDIRQEPKEYFIAIIMGALYTLTFGWLIIMIFYGVFILFTGFLFVLAGIMALPFIIIIGIFDLWGIQIWGWVISLIFILFILIKIFISIWKNITLEKIKVKIKKREDDLFFFTISIMFLLLCVGLAVGTAYGLKWLAEKYEVVRIITGIFVGLGLFFNPDFRRRVSNYIVPQISCLFIIFGPFIIGGIFSFLFDKIIIILKTIGNLFE